MSLVTYKKKRNFEDTPEPKGKAAKKEGKLIFVVQRHHASHLHYDFRLELNGTLKSWAVPKGPSLNPKDKRLAMHVEDHPIDYATFEGDIPEGNYGAGHVDVWDHGTYEPVDEDHNVITPAAFAKNLKAGNIKFRMHGRKLKGEFALVNLKKDEKSWLLIKHRDEHATDEDYNSEDYAKKSSLAYTATRNAGKVKKKLIPVLLPTNHKHKSEKYITPMLAKLHDAPFNDANWIFEIKWDGYRAIAETGKGTEPKLYSRNKLNFADKYPSIFEELKKVKKDAIIDGEIVALDENGAPSFQLLQSYDPETTPLVYYVFDCLYVDGKSIEDKPLTERKAILKKLLPKSDLIKYCDHIETEGKAFFALAKKQDLEGIIAKRADSNYSEGARSNDWLKIKNVQTQEAVIAGYTEPRGGRNFFGALVLGIYEGKKLMYIGHTGTGFDDKTLKDTYNKLQPLVTDNSPFEEKVKVNAPVTWVKPKLVCNVKFSEITKDNIRRHPVFMGLRVDKAAKDVHAEFALKKETKKATRKTAK